MMRPILAAMLATSMLSACLPQDPAVAIVEELPEFIPEGPVDPMPEQNESSSTAAEASSGGVSITGSASAGIVGGS